MKPAKISGNSWENHNAVNSVARNFIFEILDYGIIVIDSRNLITDKNPAAVKILHKPLEYGSNLFDIFPSLEEKVTSLHDTESEFKYIHDEMILNFRLSRFKDPENRIQGNVIIFKDVTEQVEKEELLKQINERLHSQIQEVEVLQAKLRQDAIHDMLTGAYNRRYLEEVLPSILLKSKMQNSPIGFIEIDIDNFKQINDTYGHCNGDRFLKKLVHVLSMNIRGSDIICRYGGDEFIIILYNSSLENTIKRMEIVREEFGKSYEEVSGYSLNTTISVGLCEFPRHGESLEQLLIAADLALYNSKKNGRNRVEKYEEKLFAASKFTF